MPLRPDMNSGRPDRDAFWANALEAPKPHIEDGTGLGRETAQSAACPVSIPVCPVELPAGAVRRPSRLTLGNAGESAE